VFDWVARAPQGIQIHITETVLADKPV
jgi:hypothetical protein